MANAAPILERYSVEKEQRRDESIARRLRLCQSRKKVSMRCALINSFSRWRERFDCVN